MSRREAAERVVGKVVEEAREELTTSLQEGLKEALEILDSAEREIKAEVASLLEERHRAADALGRRIDSEAEIAARNLYLKALEEGIEKAIEKALSRLGSRSYRRHYLKRLEVMVEEAVRQVGGEEVVIAGAKRDLRELGKIAKQLSKRLGVAIEVSKEPLDALGGVRAWRKDGSVRYDNTVEARVDRVKPLLRRRLTELWAGG
jgi:V/A-type H+-transporting ATPase subunit E